MKNIALLGLSGSGKSTAATYLAEKYNYQLCSSGKICRDISKIIFDSEKREYLNLIGDALRTIDSDIFMKAAIRKSPKPMVFDSIRFLTNLNVLEGKNFVILKIECKQCLAIERLKKRGQIFDIKKDLKHNAEIEIDSLPFDYQITNEGSIGGLYSQIDAFIKEIKNLKNLTCK